MTHICVSESGQHWFMFDAKPITEPMMAYSMILSIGRLGTNFSEIRIGSFSFKKMHMKLSSANGGHFLRGMS